MFFLTAPLLMPWFRKSVNSPSIRNWFVKVYFGPVDLPDWDKSHRVFPGLWEAIALADDEPKRAMEEYF